LSDEDFEAHVRASVCQDLSEHGGQLVLAPGNLAYSYAVRRFGHAVKVGDLIGVALDEASKRGVKEVVLVSLPGKLVKLSSGMLNTHNKFGDCRVESITHSAILAGLSWEKVREVAKARSVSEALYLLGEEGSRAVMEVVAGKALKVIKRVLEVPVTVIALDERGEKALAEVRG